MFSFPNFKCTAVNGILYIEWVSTWVIGQPVLPSQFQNVASSVLLLLKVLHFSVTLDAEQQTRVIEIVLSQRHIFKFYIGVEVEFHVFLIAAINGSDWPIARLCHLNVCGRVPSCRWTGWACPEDILGKTKTFPRRKSATNCHSSCRYLASIPTETSWV